MVLPENSVMSIPLLTWAPPQAGVGADFLDSPGLVVSNGFASVRPVNVGLSRTPRRVEGVIDGDWGFGQRWPQRFRLLGVDRAKQRTKFRELVRSGLRQIVLF